MAHLTASTPALGRPGIEKIVQMYPTQSDAYFQQLAGETINTALRFITVYTEGDFGYADVINEGTPMTFDDWTIPYTFNVTPKIRVLGWEATREGQESDQYGLYAKSATKLRYGLVKTMERNVADIFNNATSTSAPYITPDAAAFISTAHLYEDGTTANRPTTDIAFGALALEQALQELMAQLGHRGDPMPQDGPFTLVVPTELAGVAHRVVEASGMAQTAYLNEPNALVKKARISVHVNPWLTDTNNWFLIPTEKSRRGICTVRRRAPSLKTDYDINTNMMYALFIKDWRGHWGSIVS